MPPLVVLLLGGESIETIAAKSAELVSSSRIAGMAENSKFDILFSESALETFALSLARW